MHYCVVSLSFKQCLSSGLNGYIKNIWRTLLHNIIVSGSVLFFLCFQSLTFFHFLCSAQEIIVKATSQPQNRGFLQCAPLECPSGILTLQTSDIMELKLIKTCLFEHGHVKSSLVLPALLFTLNDSVESSGMQFVFWDIMTVDGVLHV